jgi:hypothetical protein
MSSPKAAEVASRAGVVQQAAPKAVKSTREQERIDSAHVAHEDGDEAHGAEASLQASPEKRIARQANTRRRRAEQGDVRRQDETRESEGRLKTGETESSEAARSTKKSEKKSKVLLRRDASWTPERGLAQAQSTLNQQGLLNQASIQFEQANRDNLHQPYSPFGQQQQMLDALINMTEMLYHQHTGDKAGEIYNRPATRQILSALKGLKDQGQGTAVSSDSPVAEVRPRRRKKREFMAEMARIERVQKSLQPVALPADYEPLDLVA